MSKQEKPVLLKRRTVKAGYVLSRKKTTMLRFANDMKEGHYRFYQDLKLKRSGYEK